MKVEAVIDDATIASDSAATIRIISGMTMSPHSAPKQCLLEVYRNNDGQQLCRVHVGIHELQQALKAVLEAR